MRPLSVRQLIDHNIYTKKRSAHEILDRFRNSLVVRALRLSKGSIRGAADLLQISPTILKRWMREGGIDRFWEDTEV